MLKKDDYPQWMTEAGKKMLQKNYLNKNENAYQMYRRLAKTASENINMPEYEEKFYDALVKNWLCPATPIASNLGTERGLPISCYGNTIHDSVDGIYSTLKETALLSKGGGGVGVNVSNIRGRGIPIKNGENGNSEGVVPWIKIYDSSVMATNQGSIRRGACSVNIDINHIDINEYLKIRRQTGDNNRQCLNIHHSVTVDDKFMNKIYSGDKEARELWIEILKTRSETGEPFILFKDNVNNNNPIGYKNNNLIVESTNICTEITLYSDYEHSFVCCLSSLNLSRYDEWKNTDIVKTAVYFLEGVLNEYEKKASKLIGHEKTLRFVEKSRAIGIGVLGWHTLLQSKMISYGSYEAINLTDEIFSKLKNDSIEASIELGTIFGEPLWCKGTGRRHSHLTTIAPTTSNSVISGDVSHGIEPILTNIYIERTATGSNMKKNKMLESLFIEKNINTDELWVDILKNNGSVQHLSNDILNDNEKEVFLTAFELNQHDIIKQASIRQRYIEQSQSINLFFTHNADPKYIHEVHISAHLLGLKSLYYYRTTSVLIADSSTRKDGKMKKRDVDNTIYRSNDECVSCET